MHDYRLPFVFGVRSPSFFHSSSVSSGNWLSSSLSSQFSPCLEDWLLRSLCFLLLVTSAASMTLPWQHMKASSKPRWVNPCDLPGHVFDPITDMDGAPTFRLTELLHSVKERARVAKVHATNVEEDFLKLTFNDPDFARSFASHRHKWLPRIPQPREEYFNSITKEKAFRMSFEYLQFFAVGIEQIILDQVIHDGEFVSLFREVENHLTQVLCELQLGLFTLRINASADVMRKVMGQEYRDIGGKSNRNIRDYIILRDYIKATKFVTELFAYLERTL